MTKGEIASTLGDVNNILLLYGQDALSRKVGDIIYFVVELPDKLFETPREQLE